MSTRLFALCLVVALCACKSSRKDEAQTAGPDATEFNEANSPVVQTRLKARVDNIRYQRGVTLVTNLERIASYGEMAIPVCMEGLESEDALTRMGCAWVLGRIGDTRTVPALEVLLEDDVDFVRYEAASQLGNMGTKVGYPVLVQGLEHERVEYRYKCFEALRDLTGHTFGYSHNASAEERAESVEKWQAWLDVLDSEDL
ncbi:MAG: HEAT repeat domain-containing protein [Planctomycetota bacterium]|jgi:HEAT repeat protein